MIIVRKFLRVFLLVLAACGGAREASAQLQVYLDVNKPQLVAYEPVLATVTVENIAGKDVMLGEPGGRGWLSFNVQKIDKFGSYNVLAPGGEPASEPRLLKAGATMKQTISLGRIYPIGSMGNYSIRANVFFTDFGQYLTSNVRAITVLDGTRLWEREFGFNQAGRSTSYRQFSILSHQTDDDLKLYVRLRDKLSQRVLATYSLGPLVLYREPQAVIDSSNRLNVFFQTGRTLYRHVVVGPDGSKLSEKIYETKDESVPQLVSTPERSVRVSGGRTYNPGRETAEALDVVHHLSERPAGLPDGDVTE